MVRTLKLVTHILVVLAVTGGFGVALATPDDIEKRIGELSAAIAKSPTNAELYLTRAEMHRRRNDTEAALGDFDYAVGFPSARVHATLLAAAFLTELKRFPEVIQKADVVLVGEPENTEANLLKARALVALRRLPEATRAYRRVIAAPEGSSPDAYLECARAIAAQGPQEIASALKVLDDGVAKLGPIVSLQIPAIEFELSVRRWDQALKRVDAIAMSSPRKDLWLKRRAEILRQAGRTQQSREAFKAALAAVRAWPADVQAQPAMKSLARELEAALRPSRKSL